MRRSKIPKRDSDHGLILKPGKVAKILGLSSRKVSLLLDEGVFEGFKYPNGKRYDRKIYENSVLQFLGRNGYDFELEHFQMVDGHHVDVMQPNGFLTTGKVSELTGLSQGTIASYFDKGVFNGYYLSNGNRRDRRICKKSLMEFLINYGMINSVDPKLLRLYNLQEKTHTEAA